MEPWGVVCVSWQAGIIPGGSPMPTGFWQGVSLGRLIWPDILRWGRPARLSGLTDGAWFCPDGRPFDSALGLAQGKAARPHLELLPRNAQLWTMGGGPRPWRDANLAKVQ